LEELQPQGTKRQILATMMSISVIGPDRFSHNNRRMLSQYGKPQRVRRDAPSTGF